MNKHDSFLNAFSSQGLCVELHASANDSDVILVPNDLYFPSASPVLGIS